MSLLQTIEAPSPPSFLLLDAPAEMPLAQENDWFFDEYAGGSEELAPRQAVAKNTFGAWARRGIAKLYTISKIRSFRREPVTNTANIAAPAEGPLDAPSPAKERRFSHACGALAVFGCLIVGAGATGGEAAHQTMDYLTAPPQHVIVVSPDEANITPVAHTINAEASSVPYHLWYPPIAGQATGPTSPGAMGAASG